MTASTSRNAAVLLRRSTVFTRRVTPLSPVPRGYTSHFSTASSSTDTSSDDNHPNFSSSSSSSSSRLPPPSLPPAPSTLLTGSKLSPSRLKPLTPSFYTARPTYISLLLQLEELTRKSKRALEQLHVLKGNSPVPSWTELAELLAGTEKRRFAGMTSTLSAPVWLKLRDLNSLLGMSLKTSQYRNITSSLSTLARYAPLVKLHLPTSPEPEHLRLASEVGAIIDRLRRDTGDEGGTGLRMTSGAGLDSRGRIWANGRRKESTAVVWIAPLVASSPATEQAEVSAASQAASSAPPLGEVLVNGSSISTYFTNTRHREDILHPLRLVNLLGSFNIFTLVSGGGHSGQAGAVAHGLAKALVRYFDEKLSAAITADEAAGGLDEAVGKELEEWAQLRDSVREVLNKDGVLKRDPRMVERKKTGLAKARKAYTWVKR